MCGAERGVADHWPAVVKAEAKARDLEAPAQPMQEHLAAKPRLLNQGASGQSRDLRPSDGTEVVGDAVASGVAQQPLDDHLALCVSAFTELVVPDSALRVGDVDGGPASGTPARSRSRCPARPDTPRASRSRPSGRYRCLARTGTPACGRRPRPAPDPGTSRPRRGRR